jgi:anti-sigma-K factor RskA
VNGTDDPADALDDGATSDPAAEYVLGTLDPPDAESLRERLAQDHRLMAAVYAWQDRLLPLTARVAAATPAPSLWRRIESAIDAGAAAPRPARRADAPVPWWQRLGVWQGLGAAAVAASLVLGSLLVQRVSAPEPARYLALLESPDARRTGWIVEMQAGGRLRLVPVGDTPPVPEGRALEFWTKPDGAAGPTSLGLVQAGQTVELPVSRLPAVEARQLFEITLEPAGGSTIGRPTGPILFVGRTVQL